MVFELNRVVNGTALLFFIIASYIFKLDYFLLILIFVFILFEIYQSKILIFSLYNFILLPLSFLSIYLYFIDNFYSLYFISFVFFFLTFIHKKYLNTYFIILIFISFLFFLQLNLVDRKIFYLVFLFSFTNDTIAFVIGRLIKGPKIVPKISPNKTWSGTVISFMISSIVLYFFEFEIYYSILVSASFFLSDIYFSYIKRKNNLKDFSNIIKGHGGLLDRMDSILFPSAILFFSLL